VDTWTAETDENIVWKRDTPGAGFSQPVVLGEKVLITGDPNLLVCYSVHDGKELWRTAIDHTSVMDLETREKARAEIAFFEGKRLEFSRWADACDALAKRVAEKGVDTAAGGVGEKSFWSKTPHTHNLAKPVPTSERNAALDDPAIKAEWERLYQVQEENGWFIHHSNNGKLLPHQTGLYRRWQQANRLYDIWFLGAWEGFSTWSFPTPVTDGEHVYVTTVNNAVAAVKVADGTIAWLVWDHLGDANGERRTQDQIGTRYHASPLLDGDKLIVYQDSHMRVYDKRTGKKIWEHAGMYGARKDQFMKRGSRAQGYSPLTEELKRLDWDAVLAAYQATSKH
jgi:hypothetical protein